MSKSLKRVTRALAEAGIETTPRELGDCRTAAEAAASVGCALDQIAKSIIFGAGDGCALFLTAGGNQVDAARASALAGTDLTRADAGVVRRVTGFAIGGVAPIGHLTPSPVWMDPRLLDFETVWAAAGTPRHVFPIDPRVLHRITGATLADFT
ncbi:YbaK/EbsC family protein [Jannaschia marina]|uniref:YbaK/EbsC family protein n=1 Tax=Jannaschia marina TaxID=2741674 RepID=UPI0015C9144F|nr:YbaK/EbsC family protein [Jannaschia marina]